MDIDHSTDTITPDGLMANDPLRIGGTGGVALPSGTTAQRDNTTPNIIRHNSDTNQLEYSGPSGNWYAPLLDGSVTAIGSSFKYNNAVSGSPGAGEILFNSATLSAITVMKVYQEMQSGRNVSKLMDQLKKHDVIILQQKDDTWRTMTVELIDAGTVVGLTWEFPVKVLYSSASFTSGGDISFIPQLQASATLNDLVRQNTSIVVVDLNSGDYTMTYDEAISAIIIVTGVTTPNTKLIWPTSSDGKTPAVQYVVGLYAGNDFVLRQETVGAGSDWTFVSEWAILPIVSTGGTFTDLNVSFQHIVEMADSGGVVGAPGEVRTLTVGSGLLLSQTGSNFTVSQAAGAGGGDVIVPVISTVDFGDGSYYVSHSIADAAATSNDLLQAGFISGGNMTAEEAAIQGLTVTCETIPSTGYVLHCAAPEGASGTVRVISRVARSVNYTTTMLRQEVLTPQRYYGMTGDTFTTTTSNPTGGANGDIHRNSATDHVWTKTAGTWVDTGVAPAGYTGVLTKQYTFAHNLGVIPTSVSLKMKKVSDDHQKEVTGAYITGYAVNDVLELDSTSTVWDNASPATYGHATTVTSTTVTVHVSYDDGMGAIDAAGQTGAGKFENHNWEMQVTVVG